MLVDLAQGGLFIDHEPPHWPLGLYPPVCGLDVSRGQQGPSRVTCREQEPAGVLILYAGGVSVSAPAEVGKAEAMKLA